MTGRIDQRFLDLPERVVITAMQSHQRYFPVRTEGRLEPRFLFVANGGDPETVIRGNEEVLVGRLTDAEFAFASDVDRGIEAMAAELDRVSFLEGSGSIAEKTLRVRELVRQLCERLELGTGNDGGSGARRRALEGRPGLEPGRRVLRSRGVRRRACTRGGPDYEEPTATAIEEHHLPYGFAGALPASDAGAALSIADKADTLAVAFSSDSSPPAVVIPTVCAARPQGWSRSHLTEAGGLG